MGKNRKQASLTNVVQYDNIFNVSVGTSISSSFNSSGSIIAASGFTGSLSGSVFGLGNTVSFSSSVSSDLVNLESKSASVDISITNINSFTASNANQSLNQLTSSLATTGSNTFNGNQTISGSLSVTGSITSKGNATIGTGSGDEGGEINLALAQTNTTLTGSVNIDVYQNRLRFWEGAGTNRGAYLNMTSQSNSVGSSIVTSPNLSSIQTITSASYAALTPVSGTLYIIIG